METIKEVSKSIRRHIIESISQAGSGHPGGSLSMADIVAVLYFDEMNIDSTNPSMVDRDKFVLSKGHGAPALYGALVEKGFFPQEELLKLRKIGNMLQGHPDKKKIPGVEMSTGSLGQGFSSAIGMALSNKLDKNEGRVYTILGDGELQEGLVWEAAMAASHYKLDNLFVIIDNNGLQIDGKNQEVMNVDSIEKKFEAFGFKVIVGDGHDELVIKEAFATGRITKDKPTVFVAKTIKGKGVSFMENEAGWHGKAPNDEEKKKALQELA